MDILIIEDENRAANRLEKLINQIDASFNVVSKIDTVRDSIEFLKQHTVDLILSDIQLADGISFDIFKNIEIDCPIIFTTAYDQYAVSAFETTGIDYILKPIEKDRLEKAIEKFKALNRSQNIDIEALVNIVNQPKRVFKKRFMIKVGEKIKSIPTEEINAFYSLQKGTYLLTNAGRNYVLDYSLEEIIQLLDPSSFYKINRKIIVSIDGIDEIVAHSNSRLKLVIPHLDLEEVVVAREKVNAFKAWLND